MAQEEAINKAMEKDNSKDIKVGDIAPSWALMYAPGQFEFLKNWSEEEGKKLRKFTTQPDRNVVLMSFFCNLVSAMYERIASSRGSVSKI